MTGHPIDRHQQINPSTENTMKTPKPFHQTFRQQRGIALGKGEMQQHFQNLIVFKAGETVGQIIPDILLPVLRNLTAPGSVHQRVVIFRRSLRLRLFRFGN